MSKVASFREVFSYVTKNVTQWFPGHMATGMKQMQENLRRVNCIIEVHDARIPFSGRNPKFYSLLSAVRPRMLVMNKSDLSDVPTGKRRDRLIERLKMTDDCPILFTNFKDDRDGGLSKILPTVVELIQSNVNYSYKEDNDYTAMVIGVPNVGKSSMINQLRGKHMKKAKATRVGATPGVTKAVLERIKINEEPPIYLLDTPGILAPNVKDIEVGLKLALCAILKDHLVGEDVIADYLLFWLNKHENFKYVKYLGLEKPSDNIREVLLRTAINFKMKNKIKSLDGEMVWRPNMLGAASIMIRAFRSGEFGKLNLDVDEINKSIELPS